MNSFRLVSVTLPVGVGPPDETRDRHRDAQRLAGSDRRTEAGVTVTVGVGDRDGHQSPFPMRCL